MIHNIYDEEGYIYSIPFNEKSNSIHLNLLE